MLRVGRGSSKGMTERLCSEPTLIDYPDNDGLIYSGSASGNWFVEITLLKWGPRIHQARRNIIPFNEQPLHKQARLRFFYRFFLIIVIVMVLKTTSFQLLAFLKWTFHIMTWSSTGLEWIVSPRWYFLCLIDVRKPLSIYRLSFTVQATCVWVCTSCYRVRSG